MYKATYVYICTLLSAIATGLPYHYKKQNYSLGVLLSATQTSVAISLCELYFEHLFKKAI